MLSRCKLIGLLTPIQLDVLKSLHTLGTQTGVEALWRPRDLGAFRSSHHTRTLQGLEQRGMVEREPLSEDGLQKPQYGYRITEEGSATLRMFRSLVDVPLEAVLGSTMDRHRARCAIMLAA